MARGSIPDDIIIRIQADIKSLQADMTTVAGIVKKLDQNISSLSNSSAKLDAGLKAFSWTTFSQGALNVSTAVAQVYTSLSNLDRVQLQVKNSMVGIERAEDLLARKTMQLNREIHKNNSNTERALQLRNEIATATEDLANKEEKLRLAQDQVNDTYILFTTNIVNTVFGTVQTLVGLKTMLAVKSLGVAAAIDKETVSIGANTGAAILNTKAMAGMVASKSAMGGMVPGLNAAATSGSILTRVMGGLGGVMGVTVVGAVAAAAVGIGAFVYEQIRAGDATVKLSDKLNDLTKSYVAAGEARKNLSMAGDFSNPFTGNISKTIKELETLKTEIQESTKKMQSAAIAPSLTMSEADRIKSIADPLRALDEINLQLKEAYETQTNIETGLKAAIKGIISGDLSKVTYDQSQIFHNVVDDIKKMVTSIDDLTPGVDNFNEVLIESLKTVKTTLNLEEDQLLIITNMITEERKLNDVRSSGNKAEEHSIKNQTDLWRQMAELKKKLIKGSELRSFMGGETGFFLDKEGPGFAGIFNRKTGKLTPSMIAIDAWDRVKFWEKEGLRLIEKEGRDPRYVALYIETKIDEIRHEPNFVSAISNFQASKLAQQVSSQMVKIQQEYKSVIANLKKDAPTPSFPGYSSISSPFSVGKIVKNPITGLYERQGEGMGAQQLSVRNYGTVLADSKKTYTTASGITLAGGNVSTNSKYQSSSPVSGTSLRGGPGISSSLTRSKGRKGGGRNASISEQMERSRLASLGDAENQYYLGLTGVSTGLATERYSIAAGQYGTRWLWDDFYKRMDEANTRIRLGKQILALGEFDPDVAGNVFSNTSSQLASILQREQDQINHQSGLIGETREYVIALRNSPQPELLDRMRYSERLEQISTGATVF